MVSTASTPGGAARRRGFTLIELLVVMAILATLLSLAVPRYHTSVRRSEEATLRRNLSLMRGAIDQHYADHGRYPESLDALVVQRYLRNVPLDPVTGSTDTWTVAAPPDAESGPVYDVHSGADAMALDGTAFSAW
jgi:general secretion pathway protein G